MSSIFRNIEVNTWEKKSLTNVLGICGFVPAYVNYIFLKDKHNVLIVGDYGGRDYNFLKKFDKNITVIDISKQSNINSDDQIIGDINKNLPFDSESFDAVVAFEVIEHLINDSSFLLEVRRILKSYGVFSVSVPFYNDYADFHLRIHSDFTIRRLLSACGFKIDDLIHRGVFLYLNNVIGFIDEKNYLL